MISEFQLEKLYKRLNLSEFSRQVINEIRSQDPLRRVSSNFGYVAGN